MLTIKVEDGALDFVPIVPLMDFLFKYGCCLKIENGEFTVVRGNDDCEDTLNKVFNGE